METPTTPAKKKKNPRVERTYSGTDAQMLTVGLVQLDNAAAIQPQLAERRSRYTPKYLTDLRAEVEAAIKNDLGLNPRTIIRELTGQLTTAQTDVLRLLRNFNTDLRDAFVEDSANPRLGQLRATLGLADHYTTAQTRQQQALAELLVKFSAATDDPTLRAELETTHDLSPKLIDDIRAQRKFYELDVAQEAGKANAPVVTDAVITRFNSLYRRIQAVARLARSLFPTQPAEAERYSFSTIRRRMTGGAPATPDPQP